MDNQDQSAFKEMMNTACASIGKPLFDANSLHLYFAVLESYSVDSVQQALFKCMTDPQISFGITPALITKHLGKTEAKPETVQSIQAKAKVKKCPLGIMAAAYMQPRSYVDMSSFDRNQLAAEFLELLPQIEIDIQANGYPDHELSLMVKYGVNPTEAFRPGIAGPTDTFATKAQYRRLQADRLNKSQAQKICALSHSPVSDSDIKAAKARIAKEMASIQPKSKDLINLEAAEAEAYRVVDLNELVGGER